MCYFQTNKNKDVYKIICIKPYVCTLPSYIQDSTHVLNKINNIKNAGESLLVSMDVESLYTNIDDVEGHIF